MGITARDLAPDDAEALAALMMRIEVDHPTGFCLDAGEVLELMRELPRAVLEGAWDGDTMVAWTATLPNDASDAGQRIHLNGDVAPDRLGEGIGTLMLGRALERGREIHRAEAPGTPVRFASQALAGRDDQGALLLDAGMRSGRHGFLMVADLTGEPPRPDLPGDLPVTTFDPANAEELRQAHNTAFADYPDGTDIGVDIWTALMIKAEHRRHELSMIARDPTGAVASYVFAHEYAVPPSGGPGPEVYVPYIGTLPAHRGRGLATGLLSRVLHASREQGYAAASLNVDTHNVTGALGIYERAGFAEAYRQDFYLLDE